MTKHSKTVDKKTQRGEHHDPRHDEVLAQAVECAKKALEPIARPQEIGEHLGVETEGTRLLTHSFECLKPGYRGWRWVATLARVPRGRKATVCEIDLLPGQDALLAPAWIPWADRLLPAEIEHNMEASLLAEQTRKRQISIEERQQRGKARRYTNASSIVTCAYTVHSMNVFS